MKKSFAFAVVVVLCLLCGYIVSLANSDDSSSQTYNEGFEDGVQFALSALRDSAYDGKLYMDIEDVEESIRIYYRDDPSVDVDLVRDDIIFHPDFERYSLEDILENLIKESLGEVQP